MLGQQHQLKIEPDRGEWIPDVTSGDIPLVWHDGHVNAMAVQRGKGRIIVVQGDAFLEEFLEGEKYMQLRRSLGTWLKNGGKYVKYSQSSNYEKNDIVIVKTGHIFDVATLYSQIISGEISALIGYKTIQRWNDDPTELLNKLKIQYKEHNRRYATQLVELQPFIKSSLCLPVKCQIRHYINSWKTFRTERFINIFTWEDWDSKETQDALTELIGKYGEYMASIAPCELKPYKRDPENLIAVLNYNDLLQYQQGDNVAVLPGVSDTMGIVNSPHSSPTTIQLTVNSENGGDFFPTCAYLDKGKDFGWKVLNAHAAKLTHHFVRINSLTDNLENLSEMRRWPYMTFKRPLTSEGKMSSPYGGPIFLALPPGVTITVLFTNVHRHACVDLRDPKLKPTSSTPFSENHHVPQGVVLGDTMYSVLPTQLLEESTKADVINSANFFDQWIKLIHNYRGNKYLYSEMMVFVTDVQPSNEWGHTGYPLVGRLEWSTQFGDWDKIKQGQLRSILKLIGRQMRVLPATLKDGASVIGDVFQLVCLNRLLGISTERPGDEPLFNKNVVNKMVGIWNQSEYRGLDFGYYAYVHSLFGDGLLGNLFQKSMRSLGQIRTRAPRQQFWLEQISLETGFNMLPFHRLWNMPISVDTYKAVKKLPCFFPDDELTRSVPDKVNAILKGKKCTRHGQKEVPFSGNMFQGVDTRRPQTIIIH